MENYYEILEVSQNASSEIIDKAYKTLAKKYHPDTNSVYKKQWAEEKFKKINEAYEIISNKEKREEYDRELKKREEQYLIQNEDLKIKYERLYEQNQILKNKLENLSHKHSNNVGVLSNNINEIMYNNMQEQVNQRVTQSVNKAYRDAYIQRMKDYGYRIYHKKTLKERMKDLFSIILAIIVVLIVVLILWQIPSVRNYIETNKIFQAFKNAFFR